MYCNVWQRNVLIDSFFSKANSSNRNLRGDSMRFLTALTAFTLVIGSVVGLSTPASAADVTWGGTYRVEAVKVANPELSSAKSNKSYLLNHLVLAPKIVAADGLTIYSRLDLLNNSGFGISPTGQVFSVAGDVMGSGPGASNGGNSSNFNSSNPLSRTQTAGTLAITSLYVSWAQEFGQLVVGRTPVEFGLGTAFNAGNGLFDHYIDTKDIVGYKLVFGNLSIFPMIGKVSEGKLGDEDDVNDYLVHVQYDNPESDLSLGVIYQMRISTFGGNDLPASNTSDIGTTVGGSPAAPTYTPPTRVDGSKSTLWGLFAKRTMGDFHFGLEADMLSGDTGLRTAGLQGVGLNGLGIAGELAWKPQDRKLSGGLKAGFATGDDPGTPDTYEGFAFSKNYDVGLLMFNHPLGQRDMLRTNSVGGTARDATTGATTVRNSIDSEAISNAVYLAPSLQYQWKDSIGFGGTLVYGILNKDPIAGAGTDKNLGYELDLNVTWKPYERLTWITEGGALFPGAAWSAGSLGLEKSFAYGIVTKAAISF
jgi:hypothetical protein